MVFSMQDLPLLHPRTHDGFLEMQYDDRYTPLLQRVGLDVISFQVHHGLSMFNSATLMRLLIGISSIFYSIHRHLFMHLPLTCKIALPKM
jgi:hypothetical protein